jgi:hypothetical protein
VLSSFVIVSVVFGTKTSNEATSVDGSHVAIVSNKDGNSKNPEDTELAVVFGLLANSVSSGFLELPSLLETMATWLPSTLVASHKARQRTRRRA